MIKNAWIAWDEHLNNFRPLSFAERVEVYGYPAPDPNYYKYHNRKWQVAGACVVFMIFGAVLHYNIAR